MTAKPTKTKIRGQLVLGPIRRRQDQQRVGTFLRRLLPRTAPDKIAALVRGPQTALRLNLNPRRIQGLLDHLNQLGCPARFVPVSTSPAEQKPGAPVDRAQVHQAILKGFQGPVERIPIAPVYRLGLAVTACAMLLLPLIYLGLVAACGYLLYYHITTHHALFQTSSSTRGALLIYVAPIVVGALLLLFMIKPIFVRQTGRHRRMALEPDHEPFLYDYVRRVAETLGAPVPVAIYTMMEVNAAAGLRPGLRGLLKNELELSIGLPLAAGSNLHQLTEVIGHELGHFAQTAGMRLTYIIRWVNHWFARVVYEEDAWDMRLVRWSKDLDFRLAVIFHVARFFIWLTRRILAGLMRVGEIISCFMMRQMEYDADRHGLSLVGADVFQSSSEQLGILSWAHQWARNDLQRAWQEGRLVDDLPALIFVRAHQIAPADREDYLNHLFADRRRSVFDTHPTTAERIAAARRFSPSPQFVLETEAPVLKRLLAQEPPPNTDGLYQSSLPASILFTDFTATCRRDTAAYYEDVLGHKIPPDRIIPFTQLIESRNREAEDHEALARTYAGLFNILQAPPKFGLPLGKPKAPKATVATIRSLKATLAAEKARYAQVLKQLSKIDERELQLARARVLLKAGLGLRERDFGLTTASLEAVAQADQRASLQKENLRPKLSRFESAAFTRIEKSLSLLNHPPIAKRWSEAETFRHQAERCMRTWNLLVDHYERFTAIEQNYHQLVILAHQIEDNQDNQTYMHTLQEKMHASYHSLQSVRVDLADADYPFDHAETQITLGQYLIGHVPPQNHLGDLIDTLERGKETPFQLFRRLMAALSSTVIALENQLKL